MITVKSIDTNTNIEYQVIEIELILNVTCHIDWFPCSYVSLSVSSHKEVLQRLLACYLLSCCNRLHSGQSPFITQLISSTSKSLGRGMLDVVISLMQNVLWQDVQVK